MKTKLILLFGGLLGGAGIVLNAPAEVRSLTLGIAVHSPYGVAEVWSELREELEKFDGIESISEQACVQTETCELRSRGGRLLDVRQLDQFIQQIGVGARLRGIEADVTGQVEARNGPALLRLSNNGGTLQLAPITRKVQFDFRKKKTHPVTKEEKAAYQSLRKQLSGASRPVRIVGPVVERPDGALAIEVRQFQFLSTDQSASASGKL